ncbi:tail assembly structural protein [Synechococcus virus S-ESS1]|uniref:Tail assembly structural protein n=1 Tax=Synechococcus virus S-ESS1 TaxID=1964565 RepID=A0A1V0DX35_9CAUD|nr:tail assembly chaperone [Synechococcus virus S-ESS1]ARB05719.1 tail assembly structural protein [Synechococcus virus S-ESS1]
MPIPFLLQLAIGIGLAYVGYLLMPKPKPPKPPSVEDLESPTAEAGRPIPAIFGSMTIASPNNMGYWDKEVVTRKVGGGKK